MMSTCLTFTTLAFALGMVAGCGGTRGTGGGAGSGGGSGKTGGAPGAGGGSGGGRMSTGGAPGTGGAGGSASNTGGTTGSGGTGTGGLGTDGGSAGAMGTDGGGGTSAACSDNRYFQVYWSVADNANALSYTCTQEPQISHVRLLTDTGSYEVGKECRATNYMGFVFTWAGSTNGGVPGGSSVISATLIAQDGTSLSTAPGPGSQYQIPTCAPLTVAFLFDLN